MIHALNLNIDDLNAARQTRFSADFDVEYGEWVFNKTEKNEMFWSLSEVQVLSLNLL